jgi:hypothetical protein
MGGLLSILVLYCFLVSFYCSSILLSNTSSVKRQAANDEGYFSLASTNLFCHTAKSENIVASYNNGLPSSLKNHDGFSTCARAAELFLVNTISNYLFAARHIIVRLRKTDIIFPFHYFL